MFANKIKTFKVFALFAIAAILIVSLSSCITIQQPADNNGGNNQQNAQQNNQQNTQPNNQQNATKNASPESEKRAKSTALADAGFNESQVNFTKCHLDWDDGIQKYEIEFVNGSNKYEYDIKADDFRIIKKEIDSIYD